MILNLLLSFFLLTGVQYTDSIAFIDGAAKVNYCAKIARTSSYKTILKELKTNKIKYEKGILAKTQGDSCWIFFNDKGDKLSDTLYAAFKILDHTCIGVKKGGKWGVLNFSGQTLVPTHYANVKRSGDILLTKDFNHIEIRSFDLKPEKTFDYENVFFLDNDYVAYQLDEKLGLMEYATNKVITSPEYEFIRKFNKDLFFVTKNKKSGLINALGKIVIPLQYDDIQEDTLNFIKVKITKFNGLTDDKHNKIIRDYWGIFNVTGRVIIPANYDEIGCYTDEMYAVRKEENWGYMNLMGEVVIPFFYKKLGCFSNGIAPAEKGFLFGIIDEQGKWFAFPEYSEIKIINDSLWLWKKQGIMGFFFPKQKKFSTQIYEEIKVVAGNYILYSTGTYFGLLSPAKKPILKPEYSSIAVYPEDQVIVASKNQYYSLFYLNGNLKVFMNYPFTSFHPYKEGMATVIQKGRYGFIDKDGLLLVSTQYDEARSFSHGMAAIRIKNKWGFVDKNENIPVSPNYDEVIDFSFKSGAVKRDEKWGFVNTSGKEITSIRYDAIEVTPKGNTIVLQNKRYGVVNHDGVEVINPIYRDCHELTEVVYKIRSFNKYGLVNIKNIALTKQLYDDILYFDGLKKYTFVIKKDWQPFKQ